MRVAEARDGAAVDACRELFGEFERELGVSLCFQGFERELAQLPGAYAPPGGRLFLATDEDGRPAGCAALRAAGGARGEMKRLYVREAARGTGLGRALALRVIEAARALGYRELCLDTLPSMERAQALYLALGFRDTAAYGGAALPGTRYMALALQPPANPPTQRA